jgi:hypothetical protein
MRQTASVLLIFCLLLPSLANAREEYSAITFARAEIQAATPSATAVEFTIDHAMGPQAYRLERVTRDQWRVIGGDATGAMYGGLDLAEAIRLGTLDRLATDQRVRTPRIAQRGIKFNLPLDLRTPSYSDSSDAAQANIPVMWDRSFWTAFLDDLARHRYNVLSLWSLHPFPSLVKVPEFPEVALDDVWRTRAKLDGNFSGTGSNMVKPEMLADHEVVKKIGMAEKIEFWRWVMACAKSRGIAVYVFTWNVFTWGAEGKHGITRDMDNPVTKAYFRASVREMVKTYPDLAGFGITAGEGMPHRMDPKIKEQWLWDTYGEGVRDALQDDPGRIVRMIHRFHWTAQSDIIAAWKNYPGFPATFDFSFKYSVAHMYSIPNPPFIKPLLENLRPDLRTWLTVRNDDIYTFRFGDPDYVRDYIAHMPAADQCAGFYMGPDGYIWGRSFLERTAPAEDHPRPLVIEKQWYSFMLVGRLAYDPTIPNAHFERMLAHRLSGTDGAQLAAASANATRIIPTITSFFWGDIDEKWFPEACLSRPRVKGFYTVRHFVEGVTMPGSGNLDIREWRQKLSSGAPMVGTTPRQIAERLRGLALNAETRIDALRIASPVSAELRDHLDDWLCLARLGHYYAEKIEAACALALYDLSSDQADQATAIRHLERALQHWRAYAQLRDSRYVPALYNRVEWVDVTALTDSVAADIAIARNWRPGTIQADGPRATTEKGFRN